MPQTLMQSVVSHLHSERTRLEDEASRNSRPDRLREGLQRLIFSNRTLREGE